MSDILPKFRLPRKFRDLLHAENLRHGTDGFTSPPKEGMLRIFFAPKNPTASARFEPSNLGTKGQHATPRPPKPLIYSLYVNIKHANITVSRLQLSVATCSPVALSILDYWHSELKWAWSCLPTKHRSMWSCGLLLVRITHGLPHYLLQISVSFAMLDSRQ